MLKRRPSGFSLLEVAVVMAISSISLMGIVTMLGNIHERNLFNADLQKAELLARSAMEKNVINAKPVVEVDPAVTDAATGLKYRVRKDPAVRPELTTMVQVDVYLPDATESILTLLTKVPK